MKATNIFKSIVACGVGMSMLSGCLNLDEELYGRLSPETYYQTEEEALSSVVGVYQYLAHPKRGGRGQLFAVLCNPAPYMGNRGRGKGQRF